MSEELKIRVFEGVNDDPLPPSPIGKCNSDYFVAKFNDLVDSVEERSNSGVNLVDTNLIYYFDSSIGSNSGGDGSVSSPYASLDGLVSRLNIEDKKLHGDIKLELRLNGIFDISSFDFSKLFFSHSGSGEILVKSKDNQSNFIFQLDSEQLIGNKHIKLRIEKCDFLIRSTTSFDCEAPLEIFASKIYFLTNSAQLVIEAGSAVLMSSCGFYSDFGLSSVICKAGSYLDLAGSSNEYVCDIATGYIFEFRKGSTVFLDGSSLDGVDSPETKINCVFVERGARVYCASKNELYDEYSPIFEDGFSFSELKYSEYGDVAKKIASELNKLNGEDRIAIGAVAGSEALRELSALEVRNKLLELTGDNRLSVTAIRDINYLQYYSSLLEDFVQPAVDESVTIRIGSTNWLQASEYLFIQGGGTYKILSVVDSEFLVVQNVGEIVNIAEDSEVSSGAKITISGRPGYRGYTRTTSIFQQPAVGETVVMQFADDSAFYVGSVVYVENADYYGIVSINRSTHVAECIRLGYIVTIGIGTNIAIGSRVILAGLKGDKGDYPTASLVQDFFMPRVGETVEISLSEVSFFNIGATIHIEQTGTFKVVGLGNRKLEVKNLGVSGNLAEGIKIFAPKQVIIVGSSGLNSFSKVWEISSFASTFGIFCDNVDWCYIGQQVRIGNFGVFEVENVINAANALTLSNENESINGEIIEIGTPVLPLGPEGDKGEPGDNFIVLSDESLSFVGEAGVSYELVVSKPQFFYEGAYIHFENIAYDFIVREIDFAESSLQVICVSDEAINVEIVGGSKIYLVGAPSLKSILIDEFVQPEINYSATVATFQKTTEFMVGKYCSVANAGYYLIADKTEYSLTLKNVYHYINKSEGDLVAICKASMMDEYPAVEVFKLRENFVQPAKNATVEVRFYNFQFLKVGDILRAPYCGYYGVVSINSLSERVFLANLSYGLYDEKLEGEEINAVEGAGVLFYKSAPRGETAYSGNFTYTTEDFIKPAESEVVEIELENTNWIFEGMFLFIEGVGSSFRVEQKISGTIIAVKNMSKLKNNLIEDGSVVVSGVNVSTGVHSLEPSRERFLQNIASSRNYALFS